MAKESLELPTATSEPLSRRRALHLGLIPQETDKAFSQAKTHESHVSDLTRWDIREDSNFL